jgi:hypothetical protein
LRCLYLQNEGVKSNNLRFWEDEGHRWQERLKLLCQKFNHMKQVKSIFFQVLKPTFLKFVLGDSDTFNNIFQVMTMAVNLEVESCGNLKFAEVDLAKGDVEDKLKKKMFSFVCSNLKE